MGYRNEYIIYYQYRRHSEAYLTAEFIALLQTPLHGTEQLNLETATKKREVVQSSAKISTPPYCRVASSHKCNRDGSPL